MDSKDISMLVMNCIKDSKTILDNYDFFNETDNDGLPGDAYRAKQYVSALDSYYKGDLKGLDSIISALHSYYEPYVQQYDTDSRYVRLGNRISNIFLPGTALAAVISLFYPYFFDIAQIMGAISLTSFLSAKTIQGQRKARQEHIKKNDDEAKSITPETLCSALDAEKDAIMESLAKSYAYPEEKE